jgi:hypothetical protein
MKTLEQYLRDAHADGAIDHALRCEVRENGDLKFYIHPVGKDGDTCDYLVEENHLWPDPAVTHAA